MNYDGKEDLNGKNGKNDGGSCDKSSVCQGEGEGEGERFLIMLYTTDNCLW